MVRFSATSDNSVSRAPRWWRRLSTARLRPSSSSRRLASHSICAPVPRKKESASTSPSTAKRRTAGARAPSSSTPTEHEMKLVVAIVRPEKLNDVLEALYRAEVTGLTISRVRGHGGETEQVETYRGTTVKVELHDKVRLEIGVSDPFVGPTVRAILSGGRTGEVGDGKIFVLPVEKVYRIRTGEEDRSAVTPVMVEESGV